MPKLKSYTILLFLPVLFAEQFLNPFGVITAMGRTYTLLTYAVFAIVGFFAFRKGIRKNKCFPYKWYYLLVGSIGFSAVMAHLFHNQGFIVSFSAIFGAMLTYLLLLFLIKLNIPKEEYMKIIRQFAYVGMACYVINALAFPAKIIGGTEYENVDMSRGIVRIALPIVLWIVLLFLYSLNQWISSRNQKSMHCAILCYIFIILSVTRQVILLSTLLGGFMLLKEAGWGKRILVSVVALLFFFVVLPQIPIYKTMVNLTEDQVDQSQEDLPDIRVLGYLYFCDIDQVNAYTRVFGNGTPHESSKWNQEEALNAEKNKIYDVDVSWAAFYNHYGIIAVIALLAIFLITAKHCYNRQDRYISYWILYIIGTAFASGVIWFQHQIVEILVVIAMAYAPRINTNSSILPIDRE